MSPAINGTEGFVRNLTQTVSKPTVVTEEDVGEIIKDPNVARRGKLDNQVIAQGQRFRRKYIWGHDRSVVSRTALWTETAQPLPSPPLNEFDNQDALHTISTHSHLFKIVTPINVDRFESLLRDHPNPDFVHSVCLGLRQGFWPFAHTHYGEWPILWDNSHRPLKSEEEVIFVKEQVEKEVTKGRFSEAFGPDLLPGMYSMPVHAVPKPGVKKFRLVTDHSAGTYALNNMISREDVAGVTLDNVYDLGQALRAYRSSHPEEPLVIWKGDVSEAYRLMPMHPLWQIKQVVTVGPNRYVDRCNVFGGRASQRIWHAFMSLVLWIIIFKLLVDAFLYVDDCFGFGPESTLERYLPYSKLLPKSLGIILRLWDSLGIPHEERKQLFSLALPVIGFEVDPNLMRVQMSSESRALLLDRIHAFAQKGTRRSLRDFQRLAGYLNWALNVYPMLRPGLSALYAKTAGKERQDALLWVNRDVVRELHWFASHLKESDGVYFLSSESWNYKRLPSSTLVAYTDASVSGMGFWFPSLNLGFTAPIPSYCQDCPIFFIEALVVLAAIQHATHWLSRGGRLAIFTDNFNSVSMFNTLSALPRYNWLLLSAVDTLLSHDIDFRVFYVPGKDNVVADHLSRGRVAEALTISPALVISPFKPPRDSLGVAWG